MANQIQGLRPDGTLPSVARAEVEQIVADGGGGLPDGVVPIFPTLAEARNWEAANPGRSALWLGIAPPDPGDPDPGDPDPGDPDPGNPDIPWMPAGATVILSDSFSQPATSFGSYVPDNLWGGTWNTPPRLTVADAFSTQGGVLRPTKTGRFLYDVGAGTRGIYIGFKVVDRGTGGTRIDLTGPSDARRVDLFLGSGGLHIGGTNQAVVPFGDGDSVGLLLMDDEVTAYVNGIQSVSQSVSGLDFSGEVGVVAASPTTHELDEMIIAEVP